MSDARVNGPDPEVLLEHVEAIRALDDVKKRAEAKRQARFKKMKDAGIDDVAVRRLIKRAKWTEETMERERERQETLARYEATLADTPLERLAAAKAAAQDAAAAAAEPEDEEEAG